MTLLPVHIRLLFRLKATRRIAGSSGVFPLVFFDERFLDVRQSEHKLSKPSKPFLVNLPETLPFYPLFQNSFQFPERFPLLLHSIPESARDCKGFCNFHRISQNRRPQRDCPRRKN